MGLIDQLFKGTKLEGWISHRNFYLLGLLTILCGLAWSNVLMSIGQFILLGNFILELQYKNKFKKLNKVAWLFIGFYLLHLLGLLWTENFDYAIKDLRVKLPLLTLPIIIASSPNLKRKEWVLLIYVYLFTLLTLSFVSLYKLIQFGDEFGFDKRSLSIYISHIRYGLNIALAAIISFWLGVNNRKKVFFFLGSWFVIALVLFELYTGIICFFISSIVVFLFISKRLSLKSKLIVGGLLSILILIVIFYLKQVYSDYKQPQELTYNQNELIKRTVNGNFYHHDTSDYRLTNGVYIERYIAFSELRSEWAKRSQLNVLYDDKKGQHLESTLIRYLTSLGLTKDSVGVSKLSDREIKAIENGVANYRYLELNPIELRLHKTFYELEVYFRTGFADGASLAMRLEYWKTAWNIFKDNYFIGVGTGDVKEAFQQQYEEDQSSLAEKYRRRTHNQYLTFVLTFGLLGFVYFLIYLIYPLLKYRGDLKIPFVAFWLIVALSFMTEDTLETQAGLTFFALFMSLFVFNQSNHKDQIS